MRDVPDPVADDRLSSFIIDSHMKNHPQNEADSEEEEANPDVCASVRDAVVLIVVVLQEIPQELLRKYILYAKNHVHPKISRVDEDKITSLYAELRRESLVRLT